VTHHVIFEVREPGRNLQKVKRWSEVLAIARDSGWEAEATQVRYDEHGNEIDAIYIDSHQIMDDFIERAR
jgi:hypothetical protein